MKKGDADGNVGVGGEWSRQEVCRGFNAKGGRGCPRASGGGDKSVAIGVIYLE